MVTHAEHHGSLVLSRLTGEETVIDLSRITAAQLQAMQDRGEAVFRVRLCNVRGDKARLGFQVPREVPVDREEVYQAKEKERRQKAG